MSQLVTFYGGLFIAFDDYGVPCPVKLLVQHIAKDITAILIFAPVTILHSNSYFSEASLKNPPFPFNDAVVVQLAIYTHNLPAIPQCPLRTNSRIAGIFC